MAALIGAIAAMTGIAQAATTVADSWTATDAHGQVSVNLNGGQVGVNFSRSTLPIPADVTLLADASGDNAAFAGDYRRAGVTALGFNLAVSGTGLPRCRVLLASGTGNIWLNTGTAAGANNVSFDRSGGWLLYVGGDDSAESWAADLRDVTALGLMVLREYRNLDAQGVTVSDFTLTGSKTVGALDPSLADLLMARFGVSSLADVDPAQANADDDNDGMSNLDELLSEFDPAYFQERFKASLATVGSDVTVTFTCVQGNTYSVEKAATVDGTYEEIGNVTAAETGTASVTDVGAGAGPNFYRVVQLP